MGVNGFQGMVITQQGLNLLEKAQTGTQLQFTRVAVGDGNLSGQDPTLFTQLIDQIMSLNISEINIGGSSNATISTVLSNEGLNTGFYWREIGIFAQDPDLGEILYCYNNLAGHEIFVPAVNTKQFKAPLEIEVFISNAVNITAQIDPSLTYVPLTGATMVGPLILSGDPDQALGAATKQYVDNHLPPNATTTQPGIVEVSAVPTGIPIAVSTTDPAYTAVNGGTYVTPGEGLTSTSQTNGQTLGVVFSTSTPTAETEGNTGAVGTSTEAARADHVHPMPASYKPSAHESTHVTGGSDAIPVATENTDGLFSSIDKTKLDGITSGATNTPLSNVTPSAESAGTVGTAGNSVEAARANHVHSMPATYAPSAHASSHAYGGADPITPVSIGAETPEGAQAKADSVQSNLNEHLVENAIYTASGTANAITITTSTGNYTYSQFKRLSIKAIADNTGNVTIKVDSGAVVPALKFDGSQLPVGTIKNGKVYDFYYDTASGGRFFLIAKASGDAVAADVLAGKKCSTDNGDIIGTMVNHGGYTNASGYYYSNGKLHVWIPYGAYLTDSGSGSGTPGIEVAEPTLISSNILSGKSIFGVSGTAIDTSKVSAGDWVVTANASQTRAYNYTYAPNYPNYTMIKAIRVNSGGSVRVKWSMKANFAVVAPQYYVYSRLYVNNVARGVEHIMNQSVSQFDASYSEDITINANDEIELFFKIGQGSDQYAGWGAMTLNIASPWAGDPSGTVTLNN